jgi:hypothetical protein
MFTVAESGPVTSGVKVTVMVQVVAGGMLPLQLLVWAKSFGFAPWMVMVTGRAVVFTFLTFTTWDGLVVPTVCAANVSVVGCTSTAVPRPFSKIACCPFPGEKFPKTVIAAVL